MESERAEWVEIIEPRTKEHMYANLATGECVWDPPPGVKVKKTDDNQWWELFDHNTSRFYYYNATNQKTVWHKPQNCDIIPLAKLQTLKQNTEVQEESEKQVRKESIGTQTASKICSKSTSSNSKSQVCVSTQTSPISSPTERRKHHHHHRHHHNREHHNNRQPSCSPSSPMYPPDYCHVGTDPVSLEMRDSLHPLHSYTPTSTHSQTVRSHDSGRSSDSSSVSQSQSSLEGANYLGYRKLESCSTESVNSSHSQTQSLLQDGHPRYNDSRHVKNFIPSIEFNGVMYNPQHGSKPMFRDFAPVRQHSFEPQRTPPVLTSRQHSIDSSLPMGRTSSQLQITSRGKSRDISSGARTDARLGKSTPQTHRKHQAEDFLSCHRDQFGSASNYIVDNSTSYPPDSVCTPLASRRQWLRKSSRSTDSSASSPQSPMMPSDDVQLVRSSDSSMLLPSEFSGSRHGRTSSDLSPHSLDISLTALDSGLVSQDSRISLGSQHKYASEVAIPSPHLLRNSVKSSHEKEKVYPDHDGSDVSLPSYYSERQNSGRFRDRPIINQNEQPVPLYSNIDYPPPWNYRTDNHSYILTLQQYLLEQAEISGEMGDDKDSFSQSDDESDGQRDDDDDFADDEGMSHQDSSSQEYLDNYRFFDDEYDEDAFYSPITPSAQQRAKSSHQISDTGLHGSYRESDNVFTSSPVFPPRVSHPQGFLSSHYTSYSRKYGDSKVPSPMIEKSQSFQADMGQSINFRPYSMLTPHETNGTLENEDSTDRVDLQETKSTTKGDIEKYAEDNFNRHKKGIFRKKFTIRDMLSWSKDPIRKPMIMTTDKSLKRDACEVFKLIQTYMLDHKTKSGQTYEGVVLDIATRGWSKPALRDELYIQICRQTTDNPKRESLVLGWELMAVCLTFFPPSVKFYPYLEGYISRHKDSAFDTSDLKISHYATVCAKRLERIAHKGAARSLRKPTVEEIEQSRIQIFRPSMFGNTLKEVMGLQKNRYPNRCLPWIQTTLSEAVLQLNGAQTEGIFRVPGDIDEVNALKMKIDQWEVVECSDPHVPASLLKQWYRELFEPLIPDQHYDECILYCNEPESAVQIVQKLPEINRLVFSYLIRFLQVFAAEENCAATKMDANNLAMVMAPNCLRCMADDPRVMFENTRKEMAFIRTLIQHLDTSYMEGVM